MRALKNIIAVIVVCALAAGLFIYLLQTQAPAAQDESFAEVTVIINEFMASNSGYLPDDHGEDSDWIEIYNPTDVAVDLFGLSLSDDEKTPKWTFPNIMLQSKGYLLVFASGGVSDADAEYQHAGFKLDAAKGGIYLTTAAGTVIDKIEYKEMGKNVSLGRDPADKSSWVLLEHPTPGFSNDEAGYEQFVQSRRAPETTLLITEVMTSNQTTIADAGGRFSDYIEIYNAGSEAADLAGYGLSDDPQDVLAWKFPQVAIEPGAYLLVFASGEGGAGTDEVHTDFRISSYRETIVLSDPRGYVLDQVSVAEISSDRSFSRIPGGDGGYTEDWEETALPTPGYVNDQSGYDQFIQNNAVALGPVVISEVMLSNPDYLEEEDGGHYDWIELYNRSDTAVDISGFGLTDNAGNPAKWRFPEMTLAAGGYITVMASGLAADTSVKKKYIHTNFKLSARGEVLALFDQNGTLFDRYNIQQMPKGVSVGRMLDKPELFYFEQPTPNGANADPRQGVVADPEPSVAAGSYAAAQQVVFACDTQGADIRYTTDGTVPTKDSPLYIAPLSVSKTGMIRAIAVKDGYIASAVCTATYIIGDPHEVPVVSIVMDPDLLFGETRGIYTNYREEWEVPAHIELIENGQAVFGQDIGIRVFGSYSRPLAQKAFAVFARSEYGESRMDYPFFDQRENTEYKSITLRPGGNDGPITKVRDVLQTSLAAEQSDVDYTEQKACVLYLNGQYWGIYYMREKVNKYLIAQHYGIQDPDSIDLLSGNGTALAGDNTEYKALMQYLDTHSLADQDNFDYVASLIDTDNYMDWCIAEIFFSNGDTGNIKFWKENREGARWRWILFDLDWGMWTVAKDATAIFFNPAGRGANKAFSTLLSRRMIENEGWRQAFLERFAHLLQTSYSVEHFTAQTEAFLQEIAAERERDRGVTGQSQRNFEIHLQRLTYFAEHRQETVVYELRKFFGLSEAEAIDLFGTAGRAPTQKEIDTYGDGS